MERKEKEKEKENEKEKETSQGSWVGLGVAAAGAAVAVAAGAFLLLSSVGDKDDQVVVEDSRKTMKAPGSGGETIFRDKFEQDPKNYFKTGRQRGSKAAVDEYFVQK